MGKSSLFILFLTSIAIVIVAELLVYQYLEIPYSFDFKTSIFNLKTEESATIATATINRQKSPPAGLSSANISISPLTIEVLQKAGFQGVTLKKVDFNGLLFNQIDIRDAVALPVIHQNIIAAGSSEGEKTISIYIFEVKSKELANEVYASLKKKLGLGGIGIFNETNEFSGASFYLNVFRFPELVFLVVKKNRNVYALTYVKGQHGLMKSLLQLLP